jgi:hypothetical protein
MKFDLDTVADRQAQHRGNLIATLLREATNFVECESLEQAAWRLADASLLLRKRMVGVNNVLGLDLPTGRGAVIGGHKHR